MRYFSNSHSAKVFAISADTRSLSVRISTSLKSKNLLRRTAQSSIVMFANRPMQLVLHIRKKNPCRDGIPVVIYTRSIDIGNLLIEFTLRHPNFPNFFEQVFKIFFIEYQAVFKALFVKDVALYRKIAQNISCPRPELRRADGIHAVPHGNDGVKIIELGVVGFTVSYPFL